MFNLKKYKLEDIKSLYIGLSNHEAFVFPKNCFKKLEITETEKGEVELSAQIKDNGTIETVMTSNCEISPLQRIHNTQDIFDIDIELENGEKVYRKVVWMDEINPMQENMYQKTELIKYNNLVLSINTSNRRLSIQEVLNLPDGTIVIDRDGIEYVVAYNDEEEISYLLDTYISDKIINSKFKIKY